ncbi:MAG: M48 family metallopeptidase [Lachnospiraceae bacterium]|nr:M48 family metallopeptidase [Lachnospiraceae bacterium]
MSGQKDENTDIREIGYEGAGCRNGDILPFLGQNLRLRIVHEPGLSFAGVRISSGELVVRTGRADGRTMSRILTEWYVRKAKERIPERTAYYARVMKESYHDIRIKDQKTRWGSCSSKRNLNFSWRIIMAPTPVMDYVIIHELSHLQHLDHSENFWARVAQFMPDYQEKQEWLKENGGRLMGYFKGETLT